MFSIISENIQNLQKRLEEFPRKLTRRLSQETGISRTSVLRILFDDLKLFPYKIQTLQWQTDHNKAERGTISEDISQRIENHHGLLHLIFFSDEAHCYLSGHISKQNMHFWAQAQLHEHTHRSLSQEKVTVWFVIGQNGILRPYFVEGQNENQVTMDTDCYIVLMRTKFIPALGRKRGVDMNTVIYQQNGHHPIVQTDLWNSPASIFLVIDSFRVALTSLGHPTLLTWTHVTTSLGVPEGKDLWQQSPDPGRFERQHKKGDQAHTSWHDRKNYRQLQRSSWSSYLSRRCLDRAYY